MKPSDGGDGGSGQTVTSFGWWCCVYATGSHEGQAYNYKSQSQSGGSSLISWEWFKYRCRKNPDLFLSFFSNRWLCCVVARTVNLKHLRVNDRNVTEEKIERACISDSTLKSFDHLVSVSDCGAFKKKKKGRKQNASDPDWSFFFLVHSRLYRQTPPCCPPLVQEKERRPSSEDRNRCNTRLCPNQRQRTLLTPGWRVSHFEIKSMKSKKYVWLYKRSQRTSRFSAKVIWNGTQRTSHCKLFLCWFSLFFWFQLNWDGREGQLGLAAKSSLACPHTWLVFKVWFQHFNTHFNFLFFRTTACLFQHHRWCWTDMKSQQVPPSSVHFDKQKHFNI